MLWRISIIKQRVFYAMCPDKMIPCNNPRWKDKIKFWLFYAKWVPSMWFWSTICPIYFSFFLVDQRKICPVSDLICSLSWIFCPVFFKKWEIDRTIGRPRDWPKPHFQKRLDKKFKRVNKKYLRLDKFFFGQSKKMKIRPDNWSTKRLTKTTWTGLGWLGLEIWQFLLTFSTIL